MLPLLWLAFSVPPSAIELAPVPVMDAAVVQRLADPPRCLAARCASGEWLVQAMPAIPAAAPVPTRAPAAPPTRPANSPSRATRLR